jgi:hypothetical protein
MLPFVRMDGWWRSGLAGAIPSAVCFVVAGAFLFAAVRRVFSSEAPAFAALAIFALNPNVLYLQSIPMTEPVFWAAFLGLLYFTVRGSVVGAGLAACTATLARYEGWFLLPFVAAYFWITAKRRTAAAVCFLLLAGSGPIYWLAHNWWLSGRPLDFFNGPYSGIAIQGAAPYPGKGDWLVAWRYFRTAVELNTGVVLPILGIAGIAAALAKRAFWPPALLVLPPIFYVWSLHSANAPIYLPSLPPFSYYNTRYGLAALPLLAFGAGALAAWAPRGAARGWVAALLVAAAVVPALWRPPVTWEESRVNSTARREWTRQAAEYLEARYVRGSGIVTSFGDLAGIYRAAGIPLRETFTGDNGLPWLAAMRRPSVLLWQEWAVSQQGDAVERAVSADHAYRPEKIIVVDGAPPLTIYRRTGGIMGNNTRP